MAVNKRPSGTEEDLEATAELPAIDISSITAESGIPDVGSSTDSFPVPAVAVGAAELADSLREVEQRLQRKTERVQFLEQALEAARARETGYEAQLAELRRKAAEQDEALRADHARREAALRAGSEEREAALRAGAEEREAALRTGAEEREAALKAEIEVARAGQAQLRGELEVVREDLTRTRAELTRTREQLAEQLIALGQAQREAGRRAAEQRRQEADLTELRRRGERTHEALSRWQGFRNVSVSQLAEVEAALHAAESRHVAALAAIESRHATALSAVEGRSTTALAAMESRHAEAVAQAESRHAAAMAEAESRYAAAIAEAESRHAAAVAEAESRHAEALTGLQERLAARETELAEVRRLYEELHAREQQLLARETAVGETEAAQEEQRARFEALQAEAQDAQQRLRETEELARTSAERVHRLEAEAQAGAALLGSLQQSIERLGKEDTGSRPAPPPAHETAVRMLIRQEGGADVVYPLGRRTTIGRIPANDIQVDAAHVSRHHAVLLSSPEHCVLEDLNSTNGVLVNGHRVSRQILKDGDTVAIGRVTFRYQQRS